MSAPQTTQIKPPKTTSIMDGEQVSFKVSLLNGDQGKSEVRRFVVPQECSTSLVYLKEKLRSLFASEIGLSGFKLSWLDDDNDSVTVETDEELLIALHEMKGPVYKFNITPKEAKTSNNLPESGLQGGEPHPGVHCDGCEAPVVGYRYKCLKCLDYDLCGKCEAKGIHPGHNMMKIATPQSIWPKHFFNRLNRMQERAAKVNEARSASNEAKPEASDEEKKPFGFNCGSGSRPRGCFGRGMFGRHRGGFGGRGGFGDPRGPRPFAFGDPAWDQAFANIQEAVKNTFDPFGVDVDLEVHTEDQCPMGSGTSKESAEAAKEHLKDIKKQFKEAKEAFKDKKKQAKMEAKMEKYAKFDEKRQENEKEPEEKVVKVDIQVEKEEENVPKEAKEDKKEEEAKVEEEPKEVKEVKKDEEDWTVLDKSNSGSPEPEPTPSAPQGAEALYPKLNQVDLSSLNPKVKVALQAMENMGFTNEGGWLSDLLDKYDGDIGKVLDLLNPAKPVRA